MMDWGRGLINSLAELSGRLQMGLWSLEKKTGQEENKCPRMDKGLQDFTPPEEEIMGSKGRRERKREGEERGKQKEGERNSDRILLHFSNSIPFYSKK